MQPNWNSPDLISYPPAGEMQIKGYAALKEFYIKEFVANKGAKLEYIGKNNVIYKAVVIEHGIFKWTIPMDSAALEVFEGRFMEVKAMNEGKMVITLDHTSTPMIMETPADILNTVISE